MCGVRPLAWGFEASVAYGSGRPRRRSAAWSNSSGSWGSGPEQARCWQRAWLGVGLGLGLGLGLGVGVGVGLGLGLGLGQVLAARPLRQPNRAEELGASRGCLRRRAVPERSVESHQDGARQPEVLQRAVVHRRMSRLEEGAVQRLAFRMRHDAALMRVGLGWG